LKHQTRFPDRADGTAPKPVVIVPQKTMEIDAACWGYTAKNVHFAPQENGYISTPIFEAWD
jgi:hypothetical protein